jgi:hypothetical protein
MPIVFEKAPQDVRELLQLVIQEHHKELADANVSVGVLMQTKFDNDDNELPSLKCHGAYANAVVRVVSRKDRTHRDEDAEITIDAVIWRTLSERCQKALLDHELTHLIVKRDRKTQKFKLDDLNRPCLGMIPDDFTLTGFLDVVRRHGDAALEYQSVTRVHLAVIEAAKNAGKVVAEEMAAAAPTSDPLTAVVGDSPAAAA